MNGCTVSAEYTRRGIDTIFIENEYLRVEVLTGKSGDVTEIRDKRTDTNMMFETRHEWRAYNEEATEAPDAVHVYEPLSRQVAERRSKRWRSRKRPQRPIDPARRVGANSLEHSH
jgi:hypothetical protein